MWGEWIILAVAKVAVTGSFRVCAQEATACIMQDWPEFTWNLLQEVMLEWRSTPYISIYCSNEIAGWSSLYTSFHVHSFWVINVSLFLWSCFCIYICFFCSVGGLTVEFKPLSASSTHGMPSTSNMWFWDSFLASVLFVPMKLSFCSHIHKKSFLCLKRISNEYNNVNNHSEDWASRYHGVLLISHL